MIISERAVKIVVSDVVTGFRHHFFNPADCPDITVAYQEARSRLDGISLIFPEGKIARFIKNYQDELFHLGRLAGCFDVSHCLVQQPVFSVQLQGGNQ